jgi:hypothetical protein
MYRPGFAQFIVFLASNFKELPDDGVRLRSDPTVGSNCLLPRIATRRRRLQQRSRLQRGAA